MRQELQAAQPRASDEGHLSQARCLAQALKFATRAENASKSLPKEPQAQVRGVERCVRDALAWRCDVLAPNSLRNRRKEFMLAVQAAWPGQGLGQLMRSKIMIAYSKGPAEGTTGDAFLSKAQVKAERRGSPRPKRHKLRDEESMGSEPSESSDDEEATSAGGGAPTTRGPEEPKRIRMVAAPCVVAADVAQAPPGVVFERI